MLIVIIEKERRKPPNLLPSSTRIHSWPLADVQHTGGQPPLSPL